MAKLVLDFSEDKTVDSEIIKKLHMDLGVLRHFQKLNELTSCL
jgi:hypothetical protein